MSVRPEMPVRAAMPVREAVLVYPARLPRSASLLGAAAAGAAAAGCPMFVGVARIVLQLPGARSLKDRRRVVKSLKERLRARLHLAVAEVGDVEHPGVATLGLSFVSRDARACEEMLDSAIQTAYSVGDALVADAAREVLPMGFGGQDVRGGIEDALRRESGTTREGR